jgi:glucose-1-phosphate thymidylyltransferase
MAIVGVIPAAGYATRLQPLEGSKEVLPHARTLSAEVRLGNPETVSASFLVGMPGLAEDDIVLIGVPDTVWEPVDGFRSLVAAVENGCDVAIGLFRIERGDLLRSDVVDFGPDRSIAGIAVKPAHPPSDWIWGCAAARTAGWMGLDRTEWPGEYIDVVCREGGDVRGVEVSDVWLDVGTKEALARVLSER